MIHWAFVIRQITRSKQESLVFVACVVLSILTLVALNGFNQSVNTSIMADARQLQGGDILVQSHHDFPPPILETIQQLERRGRLDSARIYEFYTVARTVQDEASLLSRLKIVSPLYPLYGRVELLSGKPFQEVLREGRVIVEQAMLDRLGLNIGDALNIGRAQLLIADVVLKEPDRPVDFFSLGPRIFVSLADMERLQLVHTTSRVDHRMALRLSDSEKLGPLVEVLRAASSSAPGAVRIDTYRTASSPVKKFFDNLLFFLHILALFILILAGVAIQSTLTSFLKDKEGTVGVFRALGALPRFVTLQYIVMLAILGFVGSAVGVMAGLALQGYLPALFEGLVPGTVTLQLSPATMVEGFALGVLAVALFTFIPLHRLSEVRPSVILRKEDHPGEKRFMRWTLMLLLTVPFGILAAWQLEDKEVTFYLVAGMAGALTGFALVTQGMLRLLRSTRFGVLPFRQGVRGLFRPRNATGAVIVTLSTSLAVILSIFTLERNLQASFVHSYPENVPNVFFLDIQRHQLESFSEALGMPARYHPIVRARISAVNGKPIDLEKERARRGDNLTREFNLTHRDDLMPEETLTLGSTMFRQDGEGLQVSLLDRVAEMMDVHMGDRITFNIQGVPLEAEVVSIRSQSGALFQPFFYFVFPSDVLTDAPQTIFTAVHLPPGSISHLQNEMVRQFPNVTVIDLTQGISLASRLIAKLSGIARFFTGFSVITGVLILISSILATRMARTREVVYFKILGASHMFVLKTIVYENLLIGAMSVLMAVAVSQAACWSIAHRVFAIPYEPMLQLNLLISMVVVLMVTMVGTLSSIPVLRQRPAGFLREESEG